MTASAETQTQIRYPTSGQLVGKAATFLRLKGLLRDEEADPDAASYKSAQRYFAGEPTISPVIVDEIIDRLLLDFLPLTVLPSEILPAEAAPLEWLQSAVKETLHRWDHLVGGMNGETYPLTDDRYAAVPYLRLFTLDLALRWAAYQTIRPDANQDPDTEPFWLCADALRVVTDDLRNAGRETLTLAQLAEDAGMSINTLESWRRGDSFPTRAEKLANLVVVLAKHAGQRRALVEFRLRVAAGAAALHQELAKLCGDERVADLIATFSKVVPLAYRILRFAPIPGEAWATEMGAFARLGAQARLGPVVCENLAEYCAINQEVRADFLALPNDWAPRLNYWAKRVSELSRFPAEDVKRRGIDAEVARMVWEEMPRMLLTMSNFDLSGDDVHTVSIPADAEMKAHGRAAQAQEAESLGDLYGAVEHIKRAVVLQPENADYRFALGAYLGRVAHGGIPGVIEEALAQCRRAHELRPLWNRPLTEIGLILSNAGRFEEAEAQFALAEPLANDWEHFHYARGMNYLGLFCFAAAAVSFRRTLDFRADHRRAMVRGGAALAMLGQVDDLPRLAKEVRHRGGPEIQTIDEWRNYADPRVALD